MLTPFRREDRGAIAVITAILALVLMAFGAIAVDLGNAWARKRAVQTTADLAALAGGSGLPDMREARVRAMDYLTRNPQQGGALDACSVTSSVNPCWDNDGDYSNGEIDFFHTDTNGNGTYEPSEATSTNGQAFAIRVMPPGHKVDFGLAGAVGFSSTNVTAPATAALGSPLGLGIPPFYLTAADNGATCIKDDAPGGGGPSPSVVPKWGVRTGHSLTVVSPTSAPPGTLVTLTGFGLPTGNGDKATVRGVDASVTSRSSTQWRITVPSGLSPGTAPIIISDGNGSGRHDATVAFTVDPAPTPPASPSIGSLNPDNGPVGSSVRITGSNLPTSNGANALFGTVGATVDVRTATYWDVRVPSLSNGTYIVTIKQGSTTSNGRPFTVTSAPAPPAPVLTSLNPGSGPVGTTVTISGTGLPASGGIATFGGANAAVINRTTTAWTVSVPAILSPGIVSVVINNGSASNGLDFLVTADGDPCFATSSNRGYIDEPRYTGSQFIENNIKKGLDHYPHEYMRFPYGSDTYGPSNDGILRPTPPTGEECNGKPLSYRSGPSSPIPDINCARLKSGGTGGQLKPGFFDTSAGDKGRLLQKSCAPNGATTTSGPVSGVDNAPLSQFVSGDYDAWRTYVQNNADIGPDDPKAGSVSSAILECPRFAILPVVNGPIDAPNGTTYYWIIGFKALYFWDETPEKGFAWQGSNLTAVRAFVFDLDYLPEQVSSQVAGAIGGYVGSGPTVVRLVHDSDDPPT